MVTQVIDRRKLLKAASLGVLAFTVSGGIVNLTPRRARAAAVPLGFLSEHEAELVNRLGEILVPGAVEAGLVHYLDQQLTAATSDQLLMGRYMDLPMPLADFYRAGLAALDQLSTARHGHGFAALDEEKAIGLVSEMLGGEIDDWAGPPPFVFYFVLRADAVDVTYGTMEGFERLGVPYLAHIEPDTAW